MVGAQHHFVGAQGLGRVLAGQAQTDRDAQGVLAIGNGQAGHGLAHLLGQALGLGRVAAGQKQGELLAADAGGQIAAAQALAQNAPQGGQHRVAAGVAVGVVDQLEVVGVQHDQAQGQPQIAGQLEFLLQGLVEVGAGV